MVGVLRKAQDPEAILSSYQPRVVLHSYPEVSCTFWELKWANGCPFHHPDSEDLPGCTYCWLRAYRPWKWRDKRVARPENVVRVLRRFCARHPSGSFLLNGGELCDSLLISWKDIVSIAKELRRINSEFGSDIKLLLLTKGEYPLLPEDLADVLVLSTSVNPELIAKEFEPGPPPPSERLSALERAESFGFEVRVRIDPIIPVKGLDPYLEFVDALPEVSRVTLGTLRATRRTHRFLPPKVRSMLVLVKRKGWIYGLPDTLREEAYTLIGGRLRDRGLTFSVCKEPVELIKRVGASPLCNCRP